MAKAVRVRGLSINGAGSGLQGIKVMAANKVFIEDTVIDGFTGDGISVAGGAQVFVRNTTIRNNRGSGISVASGQVGISGVSLVFNGTGLTAAKGAIVSFKNNVIHGNKKDGDAPSPVEPR